LIESWKIEEMEKNKSNAIVTAIVCIKKYLEFDSKTLALWSIRFYVPVVVNSILVEPNSDDTTVFN
jgi:hypothetical protein